MTRDEFMERANRIVCERVDNCSSRSYRKLMCYCENTFRECVGFLDIPVQRDYDLADLICTGIANSYLAGREDCPYETNC